VIAAPWYVLVTMRNGTPFLQDFFWKHHFGRFVSSTLLHGQPIWFYIPILLAGLFPWTPTLILLFNRRLYLDRRAQFLLAWIVWGFVFFSASRNKLPGYLLPLLPAVAALIGLAAAEVRERSPKMMVLLGASAALLCVIPPIKDALPQALIAGISHTPLPLASFWISGLLFGLVCAWCEKLGRRNYAVAGVAAGVVLSVITIVWSVYPELDRQLSGRASLVQTITCLPPTNRSQRDSTRYYVNQNLPDCK
jgi:4-amino-4-deoxy-L-arabinose transferase-like glycosyltransferase